MISQYHGLFQQLQTAVTIQENAEDIYAEAKQINNDRESAESVNEEA